MTKIIVKLIDGSQYEIIEKYCWTDFNKELNDIRNNFIQVNNLIVRIDSILSIERIELEEDSEEITTNE